MQGTWVAVGAIGTFCVFGVMLVALIYSRGQLKAMKSVRIADLLLRLDERFCSSTMHECRRRIEQFGLDNLTPEQNQELIDFLGFFELIGLLSQKGYIQLKDANIMFGSSALHYRERFRSYIDRSGYAWNFFKDFARKIENLRGQQIQRH